MTDTSKFFKTEPRNKKKNFSNKYIDEENISLRDVKRDKLQKHYRNYENALRSKNVDRLLSYEDD